ncbi:MAG: anhydro-N-acetylmuramic acid kinase [Salibacteraceae bacterium]
MISKNKILALGLMSGTSLDGLDIALCSFVNNNGNWGFDIKKSQSTPYSKKTVQFLKSLETNSSQNLLRNHIEFGRFLGLKAKEFLKDEEKPNLIASHGHTIFHQPNHGYTFQAGHGQEIANISGLPVVSDFRQKDISLGGQGAPLVPVGDLHLFPEHQSCINIGGFANISIKKNNSIVAFDICPANYVLNYLTHNLNLDYDKGGEIAKSGEVQQELLSQLNALDFYQKKAPKSLGREWVEEYIFPIIDTYKCSIENKISTFTEHIAIQINNSLPKGTSCLITGGGAFNTYLITRIQELSQSHIQTPTNQIIEFKEALVFAFLGTLFQLNQPNCLSSVTGASVDNIGGVLYLP